MGPLEIYPNVADIFSNSEINQEQTTAKGMKKKNVQEENVEEGSGRADVEMVPEGGKMTRPVNTNDAKTTGGGWGRQ